MAHFAEIDENNIVIRVLVTDNNAINEGYDWLLEAFGGTWIKTSYNTYHNQHLLGGDPLRKNYAGVGYTYDSEKDAFIPPRPFDSWILNDEICDWEPPKPLPADGISQQNPNGTPYRWDEDTLNWIEIVGE